MAHREYTLVVMGAGGVGKSAVTVQFAHGKFLTRYDPTIEDSYRKQLEVDGVACTLDIMDTAGQEEYTALVDQFMKNGHGFVLVYSITSPTTFKLINDLHTRIQRVHGMEMPLVLIGNKCDLEDQREVPKEKGEQWAKDRRSPFFEVSAKINHNVNECFIAVVKEINTWRDAHPDKAAKAEPAKKKKCSLF
jgi:small GTP-binding protein